MFFLGPAHTCFEREWLFVRTLSVALMRWIARRDAVQAAHSLRVWECETKSLIRTAAREIASAGRERWVVRGDIHPGASTVRVEVHTDAVLLEPPLRYQGVIEAPAVLVYSVGTNEEIVVFLYPHAAPYRKRTQYIADVIGNPDQLSGARGRRRVRGHLWALESLSYASRGHSRPGRILSRVLRKFDVSDQRFSRLFESDGEARRYRINRDLSLGIGLITGLIAGSIVLARDFGNDVRARHLNMTLDWVERAVSTWLTSGTLLFFSIMLTLVILLMAVRLIRRK